MHRKEFPRIYELKDLIEDTNSPSAYFQEFDELVRHSQHVKEKYLAIESRLQRLDVTAWEFLKTEARPYLTIRDTGRGWHQLFNILNQVHAYNFLLDEGYATIRFIQKAKNETPDLQGENIGHNVLCEVKTINISDKEVFERKKNSAKDGNDELEQGFFDKLTSDMNKAKNQMEAHNNGLSVRRIVFIVINFDDGLAVYKERYYEQIDKYLADNKLAGIEVVFYNQRTAYGQSISMTSATVVNE